MRSPKSLSYVMYLCMLCYVCMFKLYDMMLHFCGYASCDMMHECNVWLPNENWTWKWFSIWEWGFEMIFQTGTVLWKWFARRELVLKWIPGKNWIWMPNENWTLKWFSRRELVLKRMSFKRELDPEEEKRFELHQISTDLCGCQTMFGL